MDIVERNVQILVSVIRQSSVYKEYKKQEEILSKQPELKDRVNRFRAGNYLAQREMEREHLFEKMDELVKESEELRKIPEVNAYLDAELALCRLIQKITRELTWGIGLDIPALYAGEEKPHESFKK